MLLIKTYKYKTLQLFTSSIAIFIIIIALGCSSTKDNEAAGPKKFSSPQQAVDALIAAIQDEKDDKLLAIFGPGSEELISSGDELADKKGRTQFLKAYEEKNSLQKEEGRTVLFVGEKDFPFPIPLIQQGDNWIFDTKGGLEEIINREIGRNELLTIEVLYAFTDAQREYACRISNSKNPGFAQKISSSEGKKDGLYWSAGKNEEASPFGPLIARAAEEGLENSLDQNPPEAFNGYYFKILKGQGEHAEGGAFDYVVDGKMILGFALVAFPAQYGASGIMTFIINQEGVVYEKDLGKDTPAIAGAMTIFDPDDTWQRYEEPLAQ